MGIQGRGAWLAVALLVATVFTLSVFPPSSSVTMVIDGPRELPPGYRDYILVASVAGSPGPGYGVPPVVSTYPADPVPLEPRTVYSSKPAIGVLVFSGPVLAAVLSALISAVALVLALRSGSLVTLALVVLAVLAAAYAVLGLWLGVENRSYTFKYEVAGVRSIEIPRGKYYLLISVEGVAGVQLRGWLNDTLTNSSTGFYVRLESPGTLVISAPAILGGSTVYVSAVYEPRIPDVSKPLLASQALSLAALVSAVAQYPKRRGSGTQV